MYKSFYLAPIIVAAAFLCQSGPAVAYTNDKNWPCVQAKMKRISAGQIWPGVTLDEKDTSWQSNKAVTDLTKRILPRRIDLKETEQIIEEAAAQIEGDKNKFYEQSFAALLFETNRTRVEVIGGIGRFAKRQQDLANKISTARQKISEFEKKDAAGTITKEEDKAFALLEQQLEWDLRIHDEREQALEHVCEVPVILSQRLYGLAKQLQKHHVSKAANN